jgi:nucleotide-binding universal stress UspA family protein
MSQGPIVAGTDGSPRAELAVDKAGELAQALGAHVHVVCAAGAIVTGPAEWPARMTAQRVVEEASERLRSRGITVQEHLPKDRGDAAMALIAVADYVGAQMIVVGNKGMTGVRRLLGSVPNRLSHEAQRSVLIVPTDSPSLAEYSGCSIVVGIDGSSGSRQALSQAIRLAKALGGELHIASVAASPLAEAGARATTEGVTPTTHELQGDPARGLLELAQENDAAIVVVASKGMHPGEPEWFGKISHSGNRSVLIVSAEETGAGEEDALTAVAAGDGGTSGEEGSA